MNQTVKNLCQVLASTMLEERTRLLHRAFPKDGSDHTRRMKLNLSLFIIFQFQSKSNIKISFTKMKSIRSEECIQRENEFFGIFRVQRIFNLKLLPSYISTSLTINQTLISGEFHAEICYD